MATLQLATRRHLFPLFDSKFSRYVISPNAAVDQDAARDRMPFSSMTFIHRTIDAARLLKNFYIAIFVTSFLTETFAGAFSALGAVGLWAGFALVVLSNVLLDPIVT